jgi:hypothetical protein
MRVLVLNTPPKYRFPNTAPTIRGMSQTFSRVRYESRAWNFELLSGGDDLHSFVEKFPDIRYLAYYRNPVDDKTTGWVYMTRDSVEKSMIKILPSASWYKSYSLAKEEEYIKLKSLGLLIEIGSAPTQGKRADPKDTKRKRTEVTISGLQRELDEARVELETLRANQ